MQKEIYQLAHFNKNYWKKKKKKKKKKNFTVPNLHSLHQNNTQY